MLKLMLISSYITRLRHLKKNDINFGLSSLTEGKENVNQRHL